MVNSLQYNEPLYILVYSNTNMFHYCIRPYSEMYHHSTNPYYTTAIQQGFLLVRLQVVIYVCVYAYDMILYYTQGKYMSMSECGWFVSVDGL